MSSRNTDIPNKKEKNTTDPFDIDESFEQLTDPLQKSSDSVTFAADFSEMGANISDRERLARESLQSLHAEVKSQRSRGHEIESRLNKLEVKSDQYKYNEAFEQAVSNSLTEGSVLESEDVRRELEHVLNSQIRENTSESSLRRTLEDLSWNLISIKLEQDLYQPLIIWSGIGFALMSVYYLIQGSLLTIPLIIATLLSLWAWHIYNND